MLYNIKLIVKTYQQLGDYILNMDCVCIRVMGLYIRDWKVTTRNL